MNPPRRILVVGNFAGDRQESMQRFAALLASGLQDRGHAVTTLEPVARVSRLAGAYRYQGLPKYLGYIDKFVLFPRRLRRSLASAPVDVVHVADHANAAYAAAAAPVPALATVHDLLQIRAARGEFPQQPVGRLGRLQQSWILRHIGRLPHAACVSEKTLADVLSLTGLQPEQVSCVPNALNFPYAPVPLATARARVAAILQARGLDPAHATLRQGGYLLNIGGGQWYKNRPGLLRIYAALRGGMAPAPALLLVGKPLEAADASLARDLGLAPHLLQVSGVSNADLAALYSAAEGLLFPSLEEGFGWPVAEAQACGCPVFTSNRAPMTEVGGDAACYVDPTRPDAAAGAMIGAWPDRPALVRRGLERARHWSVPAMLERYEACYRTLAGSARPAP
jgi:glycosyltransferase involved in cell wall biosynthesis